MKLKALQKNNACSLNSGDKFDQYAAVWTLRLLRGKLTCEVVSWPPGTHPPKLGRGAKRSQDAGWQTRKAQLHLAERVCRGSDRRDFMPDFHLRWP
jgi:hypothetical protein